MSVCDFLLSDKYNQGNQSSSKLYNGSQWGFEAQKLDPSIIKSASHVSGG